MPDVFIIIISPFRNVDLDTKTVTVSHKFLILSITWQTLNQG
jgi:hypothetical protein